MIPAGTASRLRQLEPQIRSGELTDDDRRFLATFLREYAELFRLLKDPSTSMDDIYRHLPDEENDTAADDTASGD
jgi:hypothetical protein